MTATPGDINKHLGKVVDDISHHSSPAEQQHFAQGAAEMMAGTTLKQFNQVFDAMGIKPMMQQVEKNLTHDGIQNLLDANLTGGDLFDLYKLHKDLT
jgi:hypothetical protein